MRRPALLLLPALLLPGCTGSQSEAGPAGGEDAAVQAAPTLQPRLVAATSETTVVPGATAAELAAGASAALFETAPVVVAAAEDDVAAQARAASVAVALGAPVLLTPAGGADGPASDELRRLSPDAVLAVGQDAATWGRAEGAEVGAGVVDAPVDDAALALLTGAPLGPAQPVGTGDLLAAVAALPRDTAVPVLATDPPVAPASGADSSSSLPSTTTAPAASGTVLLATPDPAAAAAVATARAAGAEVLVVPTPDPRADGAVVRRLAELAPERVVALGSAFGDDARLAERVEAARTGVELPGGGQLVLAGKRYVALYGHPGSKALGVLGEQGPEASVARARALAEEYQAVRDDAVVVPTFEVITTVADSAAGPDGDYSTESTIEHLRPYVDAAAAAGAYVLLDLQPGTTDFLTQARRYEELLRLPHVGLALDPEWRLAPGQRHMEQIGTVGADEVNAVGDWLSALVREDDLPQKMLLLHQFKTFMLEGRERIVADRDELAVVTQMDGHGTPGTKLETWDVILQDPPAGMSFGWKNFYDEDTPTLTPARTMAVEPTPVFVSYQ